NVLSCAIITVLFTGFSRLYMPDSWMGLILCVAVYAAIGGVVHLAVVFAPSEWRMVLKRLKK
ncbi:MAG: hypothetical protein IJW85_05050, partial [Clostridia bacterium]|nr:hypothetical protein [Clostridia bacterium]